MPAKEISLSDRADMLSAALQGSARRLRSHAESLQSIRRDHLSALPAPLQEMLSIIERSIIDEANNLAK